MNGKKAKSLRKFLRNIGHDVTSREWEQGSVPQYGRFSYNDEGKPVADPMGIHILKVKKGVPFQLHPECGRKLYKEVKRRACSA